MNIPEIEDALRHLLRRVEALENREASYLASGCLSPMPYRMVHHCIHKDCGHEWPVPVPNFVLCGAMPICPKCGRTQASWEGGQDHSEAFLRSGR